MHAAAQFAARKIGQCPESCYCVKKKEEHENTKDEISNKKGKTLFFRAFYFRVFMFLFPLCPLRLTIVLAILLNRRGRGERGESAEKMIPAESKVQKILLFHEAKPR